MWIEAYNGYVAAYCIRSSWLFDLLIYIEIQCQINCLNCFMGYILLADAGLNCV